MARGQSGRLVIEVDPTMKRALHGKLAAEGTTMKAWFITVAEQYLEGTSFSETKAKKKAMGEAK
jgi:hypothetical protein